MIITKLIGGLGNQMFQYAAGLDLAHRTGRPLRIDTTELRAYDRHQGYQLVTIFAGTFQQASQWELFRALGFASRKAVRRSVAISPNWQSSARKRRIRQPTHNYWSGFNELDRACYLAGYWQTSKYFAHVEDELRAAFAFRQPLADANAALAERLVNQHSVAMHIRRGDYVSDPNALKFHGVCDWDYYERAMALIRHENPDACYASR